MRIIYMGTPKFSAEILKSLINNKDCSVEAVFTKQDAVRGRGSQRVASEVKTVAEEYNIEVFCPSTLNDNKVVEQIKKINPDFICVAAYGMILPESILNLPKYECLNVHGSLLPKWRGAAPVQRALLAGDKEIGISIMRMETGMDTGDYCLQYAFNPSNMNIEDIFMQMAKDGSAGLIEAMKQIVSGDVMWTHQDGSLVTYADKINKNELYLNCQDNADTAYRKILASDKAHPCKCKIGNKIVTLLNGEPLDCSSDADGVNLLQHLLEGKNQDLQKSDEYSILDCPAQGKPSISRVLFVDKRLFLEFDDGFLEVLTIKPDGKKSMDAKSFAQGVQNIKQGYAKWSIIE